MIKIRDYRESDSVAVGILISDTYSEFNLSFASPEEIQLLLGPFQHARSTDEVYRQQIIQTIQSEIVLVAEDDGEIVGVLRGRSERLGSQEYHHRGVGSKLVKRFEQMCQGQGRSVIRVAATLHAVPFYLAMGYRKSTGVRNGWSFDGHGLQYQPMKKTF